MKILKKSLALSAIIFVATASNSFANQPVPNLIEVIEQVEQVDLDYTPPQNTLDYEEATDYRYTEDWNISSFKANIRINEKGHISVTEGVVADFTKEQNRGIIRSIPYKYQIDNVYKTYNAEIDFDLAKDEKGRTLDTTTYREFGNLYIEIPNYENQLTNKISNFIIRYTGKNVISFFEDSHQEFFWNVTGVENVVPTLSTEATIHLPFNFEENQIEIICFTGELDTTTQDCSYEAVDSRTIYVQADRELKPYEGLSVGLQFPEGTFPKPSIFYHFWRFLKAQWGILLFPVTLILMLRHWYRKGRDEKTFKDTVIPHYRAPKELLPTEVGTIIDETIHPEDITATIIDYAVRGYIKINELPKKDYELELKKPYKTTRPYEAIILDNIFPKNKKGAKTSISALKNKFYKHINSIKKSVMTELIKDDYFPHDPSKIRATYLSIGSFLFIGGTYMTSVLPFSAAVGLMLSGGTIAIIGRYLPRKTVKGSETYYELKGLYEYIKTAEKDRLKFQEDANIFFEKLLPYAAAFGLAKKWTKAFEGILATPPDWYTPRRPWASDYLAMNAFAKSLDNFSTKLRTNVSTAPGGRGSGGSWGGGSSFGGGGFSGGGFGGGGFRGLK